jgi:hypothetical protein
METAEICTGNAIDHLEFGVLPHAIEDFAMDIWGDIKGVAFVDNVKCRHGDLVSMILGFSGRNIQKGLQRDFCIEFSAR